jgi:alpha-D-xyloside xylohydrolase
MLRVPKPSHLLLAALIGFTLAPPLAGASIEKLSDGFVLAVGDGLLRVDACADDVLRVAYAKDRTFFDRKSLATAPRRCPGARFNLQEGPGEVLLRTARLGVRADRATGALAILDPAGAVILAERAGGRTMTPAEVQGESTFHVRQEWEPSTGEALFGLGQHQLGLMNIKGYDLDLWQHNATVAIPFLVSSRGYGILWDNTSFTRFGDLRPFEAIPAAQLLDSTGQPGGLTGTYFVGAHFERQLATRVDARIDIEVPGDAKAPNAAIHPALPPTGDASIRWEGSVLPTTTGDHLLQTYSNAGIKLWIDDRLVVDHWRQGWLPWFDLVRVRLEAGRRHRLRLEWSKDQGVETVRLLWKTPAPSPATSLWSEVGDGIAYDFVYGPELDKVVAGYRRLTGEAPMMPLWAFGLWQSRERYKTAQESLDVLGQFRSRGIPVDNIVQDWQYWREDMWGSHRFDPSRFPDPEGWIREIHDRYKARLMISAWGKYYPGTENFEELRSRGLLYEPPLREGLRDWLGHPYTFYDAFSPVAKRLFWAQLERALFRKGVDAWWMDATEPDIAQPMPTLDRQRTLMHPTALGSGARALNAYSLVNSEAIYEGQRAAAPDQRVFILTRSGFAGQQRYAAATWSGDVTSTWTAFKAQIPAGLGFSVSGLPYWTMDIGGFSVPPRFATANMTPEDAEEWREMNTRWFQFGAFCPIFRAHGQFPFREMWHFGGESHPAYQAQLKFDRLRYRLLPYIYSLAGAVTHEAGTIMRPLAMDFGSDLRAREIADQYLFGPALLVSPVTTYKARYRAVYLPKAAGWYDFWSGAFVAGGQEIDAPAPYDAMPLHVRAGSIIPFGPEKQHTGERPADPVTLFIYAGADSAFALYEDDGLTYAYEKGAFARIPLRWHDATRTLTIGKREGAFPGMLAERTFEVVLVSQARPTGFSFSPTAIRSVRYRGDAVEVRLQP